MGRFVPHKPDVPQVTGWSVGVVIHATINVTVEELAEYRKDHPRATVTDYIKARYSAADCATTEISPYLLQVPLQTPMPLRCPLNEPAKA